MSFSIESLLDTGRSSKLTTEKDAGGSGPSCTSSIQLYYPFPTNGEGHGTADPNHHGSIGLSSPNGSMIMNDQQLPSLADLQLLFGGGGPKAHYRRNRRSGADRKPRQAYSSKQLEKLEDEFKKDKYLSVSKRVELSKTLNLSETQIKTWFQNRRTKWKKQVTASLRQLYRHGLYSPYAAAAVAAAANSACFLPIMASSQTVHEAVNMATLPEQTQQFSSTFGMTPTNGWPVTGNMMVNIQGADERGQHMMQGRSDEESRGTNTTGSMDVPPR